MSNHVFNAMYRERVDIFKAAFCSLSEELFYDPNLGRLRHSGEFGMYRESIVRDFLRFIIPARLRISNGFVITPMNDVSTQCDVVIFNPDLTPLFENSERQKFFPVEAVNCVAEIKSKLSKIELKTALNKLARIKALSERIKSPVVRRKHNPVPFNPVDDPNDLMTTVLLCKKFDFDFTRIDKEIDSMYDPEVQPRHKHNLILSVEDGLLLYWDRALSPIPSIEQRILESTFLFPAENPYCHFCVFFTSMHVLMHSRTELLAELGQYAGELEGGRRWTASRD
jgi:hypothetical protein